MWRAYTLDLLQDGADKSIGADKDMDTGGHGSGKKGTKKGKRKNTLEGGKGKGKDGDVDLTESLTYVPSVKPTQNCGPNTNLTPGTRRAEHVEERLGGADLHGAVVTVVSSACPSHVGVTGVVMQHTQNALFVVTEQDKIKRAPISLTRHALKRHTVLNFSQSFRRKGRNYKCLSLASRSRCTLSPHPRR